MISGQVPLMERLRDAGVGDKLAAEALVRIRELEEVVKGLEKKLGRAETRYTLLQAQAKGQVRGLRTEMRELVSRRMVEDEDDPRG